MTEHEEKDVWARPEVLSGGSQEGRSKKLVWGAGLVAGGALVGAVAAGTIPSLADSASPSPSSTASPGGQANDQHRGGAGETPLTGTTADKVRAAALAKVPGATVDRVETDNGGVYEAHLTKPDGTHVTVKVNASFQVTSVETGFGGGHWGDHDGQGGPGGGPAAGPGRHDETPLTGTTADKVRAAALAKVPGATVDRVEADAGGGVYEAHLTKADGTHVTVKVDAGFHVTAVETGR